MSSTAEESAPTAHSKPKRNPPYPQLFRFLHWLLIPALLILIVSGWALHGAASPEWGPLPHAGPRNFWTGRVNLYHWLTALVFAPSALTVALLYFRRKGRRGRWNFRRLLNFLLISACALQVLFGLLLLDLRATPAVYPVIRQVHSLLGLFILPALFLLHLLHGLFKYRRRLALVFRPFAGARLMPWILFLIVAGVLSMPMLNGVPFVPAADYLHVKKLTAIGKDPAALAWDTVPPLRIALANGVGFNRGCVEAVLRAVHDDKEIVVKAEWPDPTETRIYKPWEKTAEGWMRLTTNEKDENRYYEDKFCLVFETSPNPSFRRLGCASSCHLGGAGHEYGYKSSAKILDVWHWKSTRTDPAGQADDKYWTVADLQKEDAGRFGDPKTGGGYTKNESEDQTHPPFLPDAPENVESGAIPKEHAVPYTPESAAKIQVGTIVPGIIVAPAVGDRGDVHVVSRWKNGKWTLYLRRKLNTGSDKDALFAPGKRVAFSCAAMDHSSKRHAYSFKVYYLQIE